MCVVLLLYCMIRWNVKQWPQEWALLRSGSMSFYTKGDLAKMLGSFVSIEIAKIKHSSNCKRIARNFPDCRRNQISSAAR